MSYKHVPNTIAGASMILSDCITVGIDLDSFALKRMEDRSEVQYLELVSKEPITFSQINELNNKTYYSFYDIDFVRENDTTVWAIF